MFVCRTLYHARYPHAEFHDLEMDTTMRALQALQTLGKCIIVEGDSEDALVSYLVSVSHIPCCTSFVTDVTDSEKRNSNNPNTV